MGLLFIQDRFWNNYIQDQTVFCSSRICGLRSTVGDFLSLGEVERRKLVRCPCICKLYRGDCPVGRLLGADFSNAAILYGLLNALGWDRSSPTKISHWGFSVGDVGEIVGLDCVLEIWLT